MGGKVVNIILIECFLFNLPDAGGVANWALKDHSPKK